MGDGANHQVLELSSEEAFFTLDSKREWRAVESFYRWVSQVEHFLKTGILEKKCYTSSLLK